MSNPEIAWMTVSGFKSLADIDHLELKPINIVIGPNGSGKSNFIQVFQFLNAIRQGRLQDYVKQAGGANRLLHFGTKQTPRMAMRIAFKSEVNQYEISLVANAQDELVPEDESMYFWDKGQYSSPYSKRIESQGKEAGISTTSARMAAYVRGHLDQWRLYHFHDTSVTSPMKRTAEVRDNRFLRPDGANLAAFLYLLRKAHKSSYEQIVRTIQQVAPFFADFQLEPQRLNESTIQLEWRHKDSDAYFDAASLSDGTLRFIALATLFLQPVALRPSVILVDEPELGLHPYAINLLASLIRQASIDTQVIVSTQSSLLLDEFEPDEVLVADLVDGKTTLKRLETAQYAEWLGEYTLGQLWEKNEFGGRPHSGTPA